jgi:hypothetical protein
MDKQPKFYEYIDRKISFVNISDDDASKMIKNIGVSDWHTYILLELLKLSSEGYLSNISPAIEVVTGMKSISFSQFTNDYGSVFN